MARLRPAFTFRDTGLGAFKEITSVSFSKSSMCDIVLPFAIRSVETTKKCGCQFQQAVLINLLKVQP
jgi:hypothetical protein